MIEFGWNLTLQLFKQIWDLVELICLLVLCFLSQGMESELLRSLEEVSQPIIFLGGGREVILGLTNLISKMVLASASLPYTNQKKRKKEVIFFVNSVQGSPCKECNLSLKVSLMSRTRHHWSRIQIKKESGEEATRVPVKVVKSPFNIIIERTSKYEMFLRLGLLQVDQM